MKERGYIPSLAGLDDDDIEYELAKMDRRPEGPQAPQLGRTVRPPDRDFAERMFKMFARPFDPNWKMPNLDGSEFRQPPKPEPAFDQTMGETKRLDWDGTMTGIKRLSGNTNDYVTYGNSFVDARGSGAKEVWN